MLWRLLCADYAGVHTAFYTKNKMFYFFIFLSEALQYRDWETLRRNFVLEQVFLNNFGTETELLMCSDCAISNRTFHSKLRMILVSFKKLYMF